MKRIILSILFGVGVSSAFPWGQKGHDTVAFIALQHLTPAASEAVDSLLDGRSMVYWANWLDNASHTPEYAYTKTWHYKNIDADVSFEQAPNIPEGNIIEALYEQVAVLGDTLSGKDEKALALKMITHFMGDLHQPMHMGHASDRGGNSHGVEFFGRPANLHSVWDTDLPEAAHAWSHTEWQREIDTVGDEVAAGWVKDGNPFSWGKETFEVCKEIYDTTPEGSNIQYYYIARWTPVIEEQLLKGGLRLADILNSVLDPEYTPLNSFVRTR